MTIHDAIAYLEKNITNPREGLPQEVFYFVSRLTPMVNVDLLVQDKRGRTLLSWRQDEFSKSGWHVPGGIIRFKENFTQRLLKVARTELGTTVEFDPEPIAVNQIILPIETRGHFISFLYRCRVSATYEPANSGLSESDPGYLKWHASCPDNLVEVHEMYRPFIERKPGALDTVPRVRP